MSRFSRDMLSRAFPNQPRMIAAFEEIDKALDEAGVQVVGLQGAIGEAVASAGNIPAQLDGKQDASALLEALANIAPGAGVVEMAGANQFAIRKVGGTDGSSLATVAQLGGGGGSGVTDGDKGDVVVSGSGAVWMLDAGVAAANLGFTPYNSTNPAGYTSNTGTVTAIGITTANGISGISSGGATPNLTITLGAITPSSVAAAGLVKGSKLTAGTTSEAPTLKASGPENQYNLAIGADAGTMPSITSGQYNVALGGYSGGHITSGTSNMCVGTNAGYWITTGSSNVAIGFNAMFGDSGAITGNENMAIGGQSLKGITTGQRNVAVGDQAGYSITSGANNLFVGWAAGFGITTGSGNVIIGYRGSALPGGTNNLFEVVTGAGIIISNTTGVMVFAQSLSAPNLSGINSGDETYAGIMTKLAGGSGGGTTNFLRADGTFAAPGGGGGGVASVSGTAPIVSSGGSTPAISITAATTGAAGSMSAADKTKLDAITGTNTGDQTSVTGNAGTATTLQTARNFSVSGGGITAAPVSFNGSAAVVLASSVDAGHITLARMANLAANSIIGNNTGAGAVPLALTGAQVTAMLGTVVAGGAQGVMTGADKTKLDGIATGATANSSDATLLNRANHTGVETIATAGTPLVVDSTDSTAAKVTFKDAGAVRSQIAASATRLFSVLNASGSEFFYVGTGGNPVISNSAPIYGTVDTGNLTNPIGRFRWYDSALADRGWLGRATSVTAMMWTNYSGNIEIWPSNALGATFSPTGLAVVGQVSVTDDAYVSATWDGSANVPTKNAVRDALVLLGSAYRTILDCSGSHTAAKVAGLYGFGHGDPLAVSGTGTLNSLDIIYIDSADYPTVGGVAPKLRIRCSLAVNDVAPTGNFTVALHPVTRPATSGGAGVAIYTIGAAVASSGVTSTAPAADSLNNLVGADFALPANGHYVVAVTTTATVAASSHLHLSAALQLHYA